MSVHLDPGFYTNLFEVLVPEQDVQIMVCERSEYPSLEELRNEIKKNEKNVFVYASERSDKVYGYGPDMHWLSKKGFSLDTINLYNIPRLTGRMILESVINKAIRIGFIFLKISRDIDLYQILDKNKGRLKIYKQEPKITSNNQVKVFIGYDLRVIFLRNRNSIENKLNFGLVIDMVYSLRDTKNDSLNYSTITSRFGKSTLREVRQIQKDLIPTGINREVSRQRLIEDIVPFVEQISEIELPCGLVAKVVPKPCRIILGDRNEPI